VYIPHCIHCIPYPFWLKLHHLCTGLGDSSNYEQCLLTTFREYPFMVATDVSARTTMERKRQIRKQQTMDWWKGANVPIEKETIYNNTLNECFNKFFLVYTACVLVNRILTNMWLTTSSKGQQTWIGSEVIQDDTHKSRSVNVHHANVSATLRTQRYPVGYHSQGTLQGL